MLSTVRVNKVPVHRKLPGCKTVFQTPSFVDWIEESKYTKSCFDQFEIASGHVYVSSYQYATV